MRRIIVLFFTSSFICALNADINDNVNRYGVQNPNEDVKTCFNLFYGYNGIKPDTIEAVKMAKVLAKKKDPSGYFIIVEAYLKKGKSDNKNLEKSINYYKFAAENGNTKAQNALGNCYFYGKGVEKDTAIAANWYLKAAIQGDASAQRNLACYYYSLNNKNKAIEWIVKSAEQGYPPAQNNLGGFYDNGEGNLEEDKKKAIEWYQKAADQGNTDAQNNLAICYLYGTGVAKDKVKAIELYTKSANSGNLIAQKNLGDCYRKGNGVEQNRAIALEWYQKAAAQGDSISQIRVNEIESIVNDSIIRIRNTILYSANLSEVDNYIQEFSNSTYDTSLTQIDSVKRYYSQLKQDILNFSPKKFIQRYLTIRKRMPGIYAICDGDAITGLYNVLDVISKKILNDTELIEFYENICGINGISRDKAILRLSKFIGRNIWLQPDATYIQSNRDYPVTGKMKFVAINLKHYTRDSPITSFFQCYSKIPVPPYKGVGILAKITSFEKGTSVNGGPVIITNTIVNFTYSSQNSKQEDDCYSGELIFNE